MSLRLELVQDADFPELIRAEREAFETPLQRIYNLYCPVVDNDVAKTVLDSACRQAKSYREQQKGGPSETVWVKVTSTADARIVGGAEWIFLRRLGEDSLGDDNNNNNNSSSSSSSSRLAERHPPGGSRTFASLAFEQLAAAEDSKGRRPHATLGSCFALPGYRRQGVGNLVMKWGLERVDQLGLESWIEAAPSAVPFYEKHGYVKIQRIDVDPPRPPTLSASEINDWDRTRQQVVPVSVFAMWRPGRKL